MRDKRQPVAPSGPGRLARSVPLGAVLVLLAVAVVATAVVTWIVAGAVDGNGQEATGPTATGSPSGTTAPTGTPTTPEPEPPPEPVDLSVFPDETTTGVPAGTVLTPTGRIIVEEPGTVIDGLEITGSVVVRADDVVIRNSRIIATGRIAIRVEGARGLVVEDTEIDGQGRADPTVAFNSYTLRRVHIHNVAEGPRIAGGRVTIEDSYIHDLVQVGDNHTDAVQAVSGRDIVLRGNHLSVLGPDGTGLGNAAFMFGAEDGPLEDCLVEGNYLNGGNYTINGGGGGTRDAACTFRDNVLGGDHRYGSVANLGSGVDWDESNVRAVDGRPVSRG